MAWRMSWLMLWLMLGLLAPQLLEGADCDEPPLIDNGYFTDRYDGGGDSVEYACREGYTLDGHAENYCMGSDGNSPYWSFAAPQCVATTTCPAINRADITDARTVDVTKGDGVSYHSEVRVTCYGGYILDPQADRFKCTIQGTWDPAVPECRVPMCLIPTTEKLDVRIEAHFDRNSAGTHVASGADAEFSCASGYKLVGRSFSVCLSTEQWDPSVPTCRELRCPLPATEHDVTVTIRNNEAKDNHVPAGTVIEFSCPTLYELRGATEAECRQSETWTAAAPQCEEILCTVPRAEKDLKVDIVDRTAEDGKVPVETVVHFRCASWNEQNATISSTCLESRAWSEQPPQCPRGDDYSHAWKIGLGVVGGVLLILLIVFLVLWKHKAARANSRGI